MSWFQSSSSTSKVSTPSDESYKPMKRSERQQCWEARDKFFKCLDRNDILDSVKEEKAVKESCNSEHQNFERDCASSWVMYFKQKRVADYEKLQRIKDLEAKGAVPIQQATETPKWKFW